MTDTPKRRGRPPKGMTQAEINNSRVEVELPRETKNDPVRPRRVGMQARKKLDIPNMDPNYYYRWMQDRDGRLEHALEAGYEFHVVEGVKYTRKSGPYTLYAMRQPMKWRKEDEAAKQAKIIETIKHESKLKKDEYLPEGHRHVVQKDGDFDPLL